MRLLQFNNEGAISLTEDYGVSIPPYAILSHVWETEEVNFKDLMDGTSKSKAGHNKIQSCLEQAQRDGLKYLWVDTCCMDRSNNIEFCEAINSMYRWYNNAAVVYIYLSDVSRTTISSTDRPPIPPWESAFLQERWFTRGWTLQELIAPTIVDFLSTDWEPLGNKKYPERHIYEIPGILAEELQENPLFEFSIRERMSWAANRESRCEQDQVYSLLGIFGIQIPIIYSGRRQNALKRLSEETTKPLKGLEHLLSATDTQFNSYNQQYEPTYFAVTQVDLPQKIFQWRDRQDERHIVRINGLGGIGKSTIALDFARVYTEGRLGGSFFLRGARDVDYTEKSIGSITTGVASSIHRIFGNSVGRARALDTRNIFGNWISHDLLEGLKQNFSEDKHQLEVDGSRSAPNMGWLGRLLEASIRKSPTHGRLTWHEIDVWWRSKIESLLGSGSLRQRDLIYFTENLVPLLTVLKSRTKAPRGGKRRPGRFSLLALPFILTWTTPAAAELSVRENEGSSSWPSISWIYENLHYEIQRFLLELIKPWQHDVETAISPEILLVACFLCTCLTVLLFTFRHRDKCQKYFLTAGILLSTIAGAAYSEGAQDFIFRYLFFGANLSLILSTFYHAKYFAHRNYSMKEWSAFQDNSTGK